MERMNYLRQSKMSRSLYVIVFGRDDESISPINMSISTQNKNKERDIWLNFSFSRALRIGQTVGKKCVHHLDCDYLI